MVVRLHPANSSLVVQGRLFRKKGVLEEWD